MPSTDSIFIRVPHPRRSFIAARLATQQLALAPASLTIAQAPPAPATRFVVVLDAAHGGDDPGGTLRDASGATQQEKTITLALSVRLRSLLAARGISVVTTRESDTAVDDDRRAEIANHANARACISLHATQSGSGIHIFASSLAPAAPARLAPLEDRPGRMGHAQPRPRRGSQLRPALMPA